MSPAPSLYSLCIKTISAEIVNGCEHMQELLELPSDFIDSLIMELPPLGLQNLHELSLDSCGMKEFTINNNNNGRKRGRINNFNNAWKSLYKKRWPETAKNGCLDWQQLYWEAHIQNCLDDAAEKAFLPGSGGHIGGLIITDSILSSIGLIGNRVQGWSTLSYQCQKFGHYARCLRLHNVLCVPETCELLRTSTLQKLAFLRIKSKSHIAGWLSNVDRKFVEFPLSLEPDISLKSLTVLNLKGNNLGKDDAKDLSNVLYHMPNLRSIDISDNPIEDDGIRSLIPYFVKAREKAFPISDIKIGNCDLSDGGVSEFLKGLPMRNEPLNSLSLADNELGSSIAPTLAEFLSTSCVRILNIEDIGLGPSGFQELEKSLRKKVELVNINISKNRGGMETARFICKLILHGPNLVSVDASFNLMPSESLAVINDALKISTGKLEHIILVGNANLYNSKNTSAVMEFRYFGKPIVALSSLPSSTTPYDDDP